MCVFVSVGRTAFPWSRSSTGQQKKPDSEPSRRSIVEERIPPWLCKAKPSKAEQAENQHGLQFVPSAWLVALWNLTESQEWPTHVGGSGWRGDTEKPRHLRVCHFWTLTTIISKVDLSNTKDDRLWSTEPHRWLWFIVAESCDRDVSAFIYRAQLYMRRLSTPAVGL